MRVRRAQGVEELSVVCYLLSVEELWIMLRVGRDQSSERWAQGVEELSVVRYLLSV